MGGWEDSNCWVYGQSGGQRPAKSNRGLALTSTLLYEVSGMTLFDLLFIGLFLLAVGALLAAACFAVRQQYGRARRILWRLLIGAAAYMTVVIAVSLSLPRRIIKVGDPECFDDWCVSVVGYRRTVEGDHLAYRVDLRLFSQARRISQREHNLAVYLTDEQGRRYDSLANKSDLPFHVLLRPQESIVASREFLLPAKATQVGAVITHKGGFPIGWFIIGYDTWFRKPPLVELP